MGYKYLPGILTGYNEAFIIDQETRDRLVAASPKNAEIIRPILRGRDIRKYKADWPGLYIIYIPWHFPFHEDNTIQGPSVEAENNFKNSYPAIYNHLLLYKNQLSERNKAETGVRYEWYALQRWGSKYYTEFNNSKIVYPGLMRISKRDSADFPRFYYDEDEKYNFTNDIYFIVGKNLKYLTGLLNSKITRFIFPYYMYSFDSNGFKVFTEYFEKIPFVQVTEEKENSVVEIVEDILLKKKQNSDTKYLEIKLDQIIFELYNLTTEEIDYIDSIKEISSEVKL